MELYGRHLAWLGMFGPYLDLATPSENRRTLHLVPTENRRGLKPFFFVLSQVRAFVEWDVASF